MTQPLVLHKGAVSSVGCSTVPHDMIREHNVNIPFYTDDTQLYISVEPNDVDAVCSLTTCLSVIND